MTTELNRLLEPEPDFDPLTPDDLARMRAHHRPEFGWCSSCNANWPCDAVRLLDEVERLRRRRDGKDASVTDWAPGDIAMLAEFIGLDLDEECINDVFCYCVDCFDPSSDAMLRACERRGWDVEVMSYVFEGERVRRVTMHTGFADLGTRCAPDAGSTQIALTQAIILALNTQKKAPSVSEGGR